MAAQQSENQMHDTHEHEVNQNEMRVHHVTPEEDAVHSGMNKNASVLKDPEDMVLLREKLNQIAFGMRSKATTATAKCHFKLFPLLDRPSTPPSSPQPRDVLRKQLLLKNQLQQPTRHMYPEDELNRMCVDAVEITPLDLHATASNSKTSSSMTTTASYVSTVTTTTTSTPMMSSFSVMNKCPEGLRKRKSMHMEPDETTMDTTEDVRLKKMSSSQVTVLDMWDSTSSSSSGSSSSASVYRAPELSPLLQQQPGAFMSACS